MLTFFFCWRSLYFNYIFRFLLLCSKFWIICIFFSRPVFCLHTYTTKIICCISVNQTSSDFHPWWTYGTDIAPYGAMSVRWLRVSQRNLFVIVLNQTEIRLYLPFSDWFGTKRTSVWFQINRKMVNTVWFWFDLIKCRKDFSVCIGRKYQPVKQGNVIYNLLGQKLKMASR